MQGNSDTQPFMRFLFNATGCRSSPIDSLFHMRELISFDLPALELTDVAVVVVDVRLFTTSVSLSFAIRSNSFMLNLFLTHTIANAATGRNLEHAKLRIDSRQGARNNSADAVRINGV